jgi:hypothetical protein
MDRDKMSKLYREPSIDASYQVSVHLAKGFQTQGLAVIFSHHQVCIKKKKGGPFLGDKSEKYSFGTFFRFKNGLVFVLPLCLKPFSQMN